AGLSAFLSLLVAALLFAGSATRLPLLIRPRTKSMALVLVAIVLMIVIAYGVSAFIWTEEYEDVPITLPWGSYVTAGATILMLAFAIWRNFVAYSLSRLPMQWALVTGLVLLAEAQVSMAISPVWSLAWWEYHFLMLLGAGAAMAGLLVQYSKVGSFRKIMAGVFELQGLVETELGNAETIAALAAATEAKDPFTKGHTVRVAETAVALGRALNLPNDKLRVLVRAGLLHDIGKLGIPDAILLKPGQLTDEEFKVIKKHPLLGFEILERVGSLEQEIKVIRAHHERIDGSGYPQGLSGDQIPIETRVIAVADTYDSTVSDRPYRKGLPLERVKQILREEAGSHLDPQVVEVCLRLIDEGKLPGSGR
ncbi:MAG: HD-GYP domain-containing protein, partial [Dehalococcoidia bacterium]|nr:HD-GYP domain-containing protein [Dehalococcoidia bacterium]